ncbi:hypothetical protein GBAR_LOCUS8508 [Geodia barretti]|uniref:Uncharacterized protein n=1 Tax=Geodia barretti TaxID=519541 RepID=A0AA35RLS1_GEOBA|nr:hypothetical protein GBAR_LOCUS8508 [Geodia barretti]
MVATVDHRSDVLRCHHRNLQETPTVHRTKTLRGETLIRAHPTVRQIHHHGNHVVFVFYLVCVYSSFLHFLIIIHTSLLLLCV